MKTQALMVFLSSLLIVFLAFQFQQQLGNFKSLGLLGIFLINLFGSATVFLPAPALATVFAGGGVYSPFWVAIIAALGSSIGELSGFLLGHSGKKVFLGEYSHTLYKTIRKLFHRYGGLMVLVISFIPNPLFDAVGIIAGALAYSPRKFFFYVLIGRILRDLMLAYFGHRFFG